jgi:hypothetical protein
MDAGDRSDLSEGHGIQRVGLMIATAVVAINIWTGAPLFAVWVGSQVQGESGVSMTALFVVVLVLAATVLSLTWVLAWLNARYDVVTGRPQPPRQPLPWLKSLSGERELETRRRVGVTAVERIVVISVVAAVLAFEIWFFFLAGSSLPGG